MKSYFIMMDIKKTIDGLHFDHIPIAMCDKRFPMKQFQTLSARKSCRLTKSCLQPSSTVAEPPQQQIELSTSS